MEGTQIQDQDVDKRLNELAENKERNDEENKEFETLRKEKDGRETKKRIDELTWKSKTAAEEADRLREENERLREQKEDKHEDPIVKKKTVEHNGKQFYVDTTLTQMIKSGEISETEAYKHQQDRIEEAAADRAYKRLKGEQEKSEKQNALMKETEAMFTKYPTWNKTHPDFNPSDPVYKTADEYFKAGLSPRKAMETAEKLHGVAKKPDISDDLGTFSPGAPSQQKTDKLPPLDEDGKDRAWRMYRDQVNPKTGKQYTEAEAHSKYQRAMSSRPSRRA